MVSPNPQVTTGVTSFGTAQGDDILKAAAKKCRELDVALATWGDITFNYESTDVPDVVETPTSS